MGVGLMFWVGSDVGRDGTLPSKLEMDDGPRFVASASCIDGNECRWGGGGGCPLSSSTGRRDSVGGPHPPKVVIELAADDGYEYGGGGPEYKLGLTRGAGMFSVAEAESLGLYVELSFLIFSVSRKAMEVFIEDNESLPTRQSPGRLTPSCSWHLDL